MEQIHKERMRKLIGFLRELPRKKFYFGDLIKKSKNDCCSVGCAVGWLPRLFPDLVEWVPERVIDDSGEYTFLRVQAVGEPSVNVYVTVAAFVFGISENVALNLFTPEAQHFEHLPRLRNDASSSDVADMLEQFLELVKSSEINPLDP